MWHEGESLHITILVRHKSSTMTVKKILFPIFSVFLAYRSFELVRQMLDSNPNSLNISEMFLLSFLLALFITGIFAFPGFAYPTSNLLSKNYYQIKSKDKLKWMYSAFRVEYFRILLLKIFWGSRKNRVKYFDGTRQGLNNLKYQTQQSEFGHLGALVSISIVSILLLIDGYIILVIFITLINVIGNLYPVILQRHHRMRIELLAARYKDLSL